MSVSTDNLKIQELLNRSVQEIFPNKEFLEKKLEAGERLTLYAGFDPTGPILHIGHGLVLLKLKQFQDLGHKVIFLIGDTTAMIGDPTDKTTARQKLTQEQVAKNCKGFKAQAANIVDFEGDNPVELRYNSEWWNEISFTDTIELASHFTVQQMLQRDMFQQRMKQEKPVYLHEFLYPLMQGYDSVAMSVDGEVGGNDQMFNMLAGRELQKELQQKDKFVITMKLLTATNGEKMGKTTGNMIAFTDAPKDMFGKIMTWEDGMIVPAFELCTKLTMQEIEEISKNLEKGNNPRDAKLELAYEITKTFLGKQAADEGKKHFSAVIQGDALPEDIPEITPTAYDIVTVLVEAELVQSTSEARRLIEQGGVRINENKVEQIDQEVTTGDIIQKGKRHFVKVAV